MRHKKTLGYILVLCLSAAFLPLAAWAGSEWEQWPHPNNYLPSTSKVMKQKATYDDKRDLFQTFHPKDFVIPEIWGKITFDIPEMKKKTAEIYGYTAQELVGKIAPEIKPGKYTYEDLEKYPGLKELFTPMLLRTVRAGGPPHVCAIRSFEIEPTRQLHLPLPTCEVTLENMGKTQLDENGYIVPGTWKGGVPFPRPSGKFKAQQVFYNLEKRIQSYDGCNQLTGEGLSFDKNLKLDKYNKYVQTKIKLMGRTLIPPYGWFDKRAEKRGEFKATSSLIYEPRATRGLVTLRLQMDDPLKMDPFLIYTPSLRRIRKQSATDTQEPTGDSTYDDRSFISQKITPKRYPYKFEIIGEREFLTAFSYNAGKVWVDKEKGYSMQDLGMMRRPCYVLQMTQLDSNYIYSKRIYYVDKETWGASFAEFYDQKGRLYRTYNLAFGFVPECGQLVPHGTPAWQLDYLDTHSSYQVLVYMPANLNRNDFNMKNIIKMGK